MPESPTANMLLVKPTDHSDTDTWGALVNAALDLIDAHDHSTGKGTKVPSAGLKINADVSWSFGGTNYAITDAKAFDFTPVTAASMTAYSSALFTNSSDANNLYFRNASGTNVKITDGSTLNISIVGGIGGDYTSIGALLDYDDATDTYRLRQQTSASVRQFAKMSSANVQLFEYKAAGDPTVPTNSVRLASPAALAASYTLTWMAALPGAQALLQVSSAGVVTSSNTTTEEIIAADFLNTTSIGVNFQAVDWNDASAAHTRSLGGTSGAQNRWTIAASVAPLSISLRLPVGAIITAYTVYLDKNTNGSATVSARLYSTRTATGAHGTESALGSGSSSSANAPDAIQLQETGLSIATLNAFEYYLVFTPSGSVTGAADILYNADVSYTRA